MGGGYSKETPARYEGSYFDPFYHNKDEAEEYPEYDDEIDENKYYKFLH